MKRIYAYSQFLLMVSLAILTSCSGCKTSKPEVSAEQDLDTLTLENMEIMLPAPSEVIELVLTSGVKFSSNYVAPLGLDKKTAMVKHKAVTLGVYFADFAYTNFYSQRSLSADYFKALQQISSDLGIGSILNDAYFNRFDANLNNPDSLDAIFEDFSQNAYNTIIESGNSELLSMIGIGAAIEILYIGINSIETAGNTDEAVETILEHSAVFTNYYNNFMAYNGDKPEFKALNDDVTKIFSFFKEKLAGTEKETVVKDSKQHYTIAGGETNKLSKTDLAQLRKLVADTRSKLIDLKY